MKTAAVGNGILEADSSAYIYEWGERRGVVQFSSTGVEGQKSGVRSLLPSAAPVSRDELGITSLWPIFLLF